MSGSVDLNSRLVGCLLGGAMGDTWGGPWEGKPGPISFHVPERPVLSDDTEFTLATCEAIIESGSVEPATLAAHFVRWFRAGRIHGMGSSTLKAVRDLVAGTHWALAGARGEYAAGSGAAMRIAPLAFLLDPVNPDHRVVIRDVSRITHHSEEAYVGSLAVLLAIHSILVGAWSPQGTFLALTLDNLPRLRGSRPDRATGARTTPRSRGGSPLWRFRSCGRHSVACAVLRAVHRLQ